ncbi:SAV_915 family protein [Streptomyces sp. NRRL S-920]|uniref:SAV_915 family protein n=1 Tax=Streptomyces sp. NRRL S-920 TaxID=1463921 RepID=UPI0004CC3FCA|nr:SAV_915 family protein [Streptomyces sp. NRRL S-920]
MAKLLRDEDPEPCERGPAGPLFVPVRPGPAGCVARLFRTPVGERTAVAFTTAQRLRAALGLRQAWIRLSEPALRALAAPLGVSGITVDPRLAAHPVGPAPAPAPAPVRLGERRAAARHGQDPLAVGAPRASGPASFAGAPTPWTG